MAHEIFKVLREGGYADRETILADNFNRLFQSKGDGSIVTIEVKDSLQKKIPKLEGRFTFDLSDSVTNATAEECQEIMKIFAA